MNAMRMGARPSNVLRQRVAARGPARNVRFQSSAPSGGASAGGHPAVTGAAAGAASALIVGYTWYSLSGAKTAVQTTKQARDYMQQGINKVKETTPEPNEAIKYLRNTASSYAAFVPGAKPYVDEAFNQLDTIREKHGDEVDKIVRQTYGELQDVAKDGMSLATAERAWSVVQTFVKRVGRLAGDAASDLIDQNPALKEKVGGSLDQLNQLGAQYGPEAKKQVDETWNQIRDIVKNGVNADTASKIKQLIDDKKQQLSKAGDEAWKKGMEQAKPYLDKNPKVKKLVEENADALKQGDVSALWELVRAGDYGKIEEQVRNQVDKVKSKGFGGLEQYINMIPGGGQIMPKLQILQQVAQKRGKDAEQLLRETGDEITEVLTKKSEKAKKLLDEAESDAKKST